MAAGEHDDEVPDLANSDEAKEGNWGEAIRKEVILTDITGAAILHHDCF